MREFYERWRVKAARSEIQEGRATLKRGPLLNEREQKMLKRRAILGVAALSMLLAMSWACDKDKPAESTPVEPPTSVAPAASAEQIKPPPALDGAMVQAHLDRLALKLGCEASPADVSTRRWCEAVKGFGQASFEELPKAESLVMLGLVRWIPTEAQVDLVDLYPATLGLRRSGEVVYGEVVRIKNRSDSNAHHIKGMIVQLKRVWEGAAKQVVLTEKDLFSYVQRRAEKVDKQLAPHQRGWQLAGGERFDVRKVGSSWVVVWQPKQKPSEPAGLHVAILDEIPFTDRVEIDKDVELKQAIAQLKCGLVKYETWSREMLACDVLTRFEQAGELKKPKTKDQIGYFAGKVWPVFESPTSYEAGVKLSISPEDGRILVGLNALPGVKAQPEPLKAAPKKALEALKVDTLTMEPARQAGEISKVVIAPSLWSEHERTKTYNYLRQLDDELLWISHDPMGGMMWVGLMKADK